MEITLQLIDKVDPIAIYAAIVATTLLIWDIVKWRRSGPRLRLRVMPNMETFCSSVGFAKDCWSSMNRLLTQDVSWCKSQYCHGCRRSPYRSGQRQVQHHQLYRKPEPDGGGAHGNLTQEQHRHDQ